MRAGLLITLHESEDAAIVEIACKIAKVSILRLRVERIPSRVKRTSNYYVDIILINYSSSNWERALYTLQKTD